MASGKESRRFPKLEIKIPGKKSAPKPEEKKDSEDPKDQNKEKPVPVEEKPIYDRTTDYTNW